MIEEFKKGSDGFEMNIEDGREPEVAPDYPSTNNNDGDYNTSIKVRPSSGKKKTFLIELHTTHYAFKQASSTARTLSEFYQLQNILKVNKSTIWSARIINIRAL